MSQDKPEKLKFLCPLLQQRCRNGSVEGTDQFAEAALALCSTMTAAHIHLGTVVHLSDALFIITLRPLELLIAAEYLQTSSFVFIYETADFLLKLWPSIKLASRQWHHYPLTRFRREYDAWLPLDSDQNSAF